MITVQHRHHSCQETSLPVYCTRTILGGEKGEKGEKETTSVEGEPEKILTIITIPQNIFKSNTTQVRGVKHTLHTSRLQPLSIPESG